MSDLVGNPEDRFSQNEAQMIIDLLISFFKKQRQCMFARELMHDFMKKY